MTQTHLMAVEKTITVPLPATRAFQLFLENMDMWWPKETHSVSIRQDRIAKSVSLDLRLNGTITETGPDGDTYFWGHLSRFDPPHHAEIAWYPGRDAAHATTVSLSFTDTDAGCTLHLVHSGFEVNGEEAEDQRLSYLTGWGADWSGPSRRKRRTGLIRTARGLPRTA
ncbi:MAG: SRPBCC domain-containing protein [Marinovum sp.]|nr:SRPBCC domain-containing protein [Marinovum sp.]